MPASTSAAPAEPGRQVGQLVSTRFARAVCFLVCCAALLLSNVIILHLRGGLDEVEFPNFNASLLRPLHSISRNGRRSGIDMQSEHARRVPRTLGPEEKLLIEQEKLMYARSLSSLSPAVELGLDRRCTNNVHRQQAPVIVPLRKVGLQFVGDLSLGIPPQSISAMFDTGSGELWVASTCAQPYVPVSERRLFRPRKMKCPAFARHYNSSQSVCATNLHEAASIRYGSAEISGGTVKDHVALGDANVGEYLMHTMRSGSEYWDTSVENGAMEAICGMSLAVGSFAHRLAEAGYPAVLFNFMENPRMVLLRDTAEPSPLLPKNLVFAEALGDFYWEVESNISIGTTRLGRHRLIFDTGTPSLTFDPDIYPQAIDALGGNFVKCSAPHSITYHVAVQSADKQVRTTSIIRIEPSMFLTPYSGVGGPEDICTHEIIQLELPGATDNNGTSAVAPSGSRSAPTSESSAPVGSQALPAAMLGSVFFSHFSVVFDLGGGRSGSPKRVGWAKAAQIASPDVAVTP